MMLLGTPDCPSLLSLDRAAKLEQASEWRAYWDTLDSSISAWLDSEIEKGGIHLRDVRSFRSNMAEVLIVNDGKSNYIAWDERFFDYIAIQLMLLDSDYDVPLIHSVERLLQQYVGEIYALSDPHYAVLMYALSMHETHRAIEMTTTSEDWNKFADLFGVIRHFVLAHEVGHLLLKDKVRRRDMEDMLSPILATIKSAAQTKSLNHLYYGSGSYTDLAESILKSAEDPAKREELLADAYAINSVSEWKLSSCGDLSNPFQANIMARTLAGVYDAVMLLYFTNASLTGMAELLKPKAIRKNMTLESSRAVMFLGERADVRGHLCVAKAVNVLKSDTALLAKMRETKGYRKAFLGTQVKAYNLICNNLRRSEILDQRDRSIKAVSHEMVARKAKELYLLR